jgi:hypothetical protein
MHITIHNKTCLLKRLPNLKLSYDNIHKKVSSDLYFIIPKGIKHIIWFTYFEDKRVCVIIKIHKGGQKQISELSIVPQHFEKKLVLGTIFYGTLFTINNNKYFSIENIHYYKGKNIENNTEFFKLSLIKNILTTELKLNVLNKNGICMALPIIETTFDACMTVSNTLPYNTYCIQQRNLQCINNKYCSTLYNKQECNNIKIFMVKPKIENDIYELLCYNNSNLEFFDIAYIPDYTTSVMMNNIFRIIKENVNLDALEESDDEDEFENINEDKFVNLNKCVKMECEYNSKFCKYVPIKITENNKVYNQNICK